VERSVGGRNEEAALEEQLRGQESAMANDGFMKPEVPDSFRDLMKVSIEQAKRAFDTFAATSERTWKTLETSSQTASTGLRSLNEKMAQITRDNAEANFALAMRLAESKDVGQAMELQTEHARKQMESFVHQLEELATSRPRSYRRARPPVCRVWANRRTSSPRN
jgi:phasin